MQLQDWCLALEKLREDGCPFFTLDEVGDEVRGLKARSIEGLTVLIRVHPEVPGGLLCYQLHRGRGRESYYSYADLVVAVRSLHLRQLN